MARRTSGNVRHAPDGKVMRDVYSPDGTLEGTQTSDDTPKKKHKAWLFHIQEIQEGARAAAERRKPNSRPLRTLARRQNAKKKQESQPTNLSLYAHCLRAFTSGRLVWDRSEPRSKKYNTELSCLQSRLLRNEML